MARYSAVQWQLIKFGIKHVAVLFTLILPFNFLYRLYLNFFEILERLRKEKPNLLTHQRKKERVQKQVREWRESGGKKMMCTGRAKTSSMMLRRPGYRDTLHRIQVDDLNDIICVDVEKRVVKVEPMVTMGQITEYLTPLGWTIPVVPELQPLTVGGLVMGGGIETSSHKYGLFHRTCRSYEIVVSSGEAIYCSEEENVDLFRGIPCSYGTLGLLTAVEISIIEAPRFVKLEYHPAHSLEEGIALMTKHSTDVTRNDFVEGILFSQDKWVVTTGTMVTAVEPEKLNEISWWYKPWFFKHVETFLTLGPGHYDYIPLRDYYHRHDRCFFWLYSPYAPYGNEVWYRHLLGWLLPVDTKFLKSLLPDQFFANIQFVQDFLVPDSAIKEIIIETDRVSKCYPIWVCPFNVEPSNGSIVNTRTDKEEIYYDIGVYGKPEIPKWKVEKATRHMENLVLKYKGFQAVYTDTYMTEEEIRQILDLRLNDKLRKKYVADGAFPDWFSKTSIKGRSEGL